MRAPKLTAFLSVLSIVFLFSCKNPDDVERENTYSGTSPMSGSQETPAVTTSATGSVEASYSKLSKILTYKVTFSGLSGNASAAHIHGITPPGFAAGVVQNFVGFPAATAGTYSGSVFFDGVKLIESELLAGRYYVNIHTAANPGGEIRGQIILSRQ